MDRTVRTRSHKSLLLRASQHVSIDRCGGVFGHLQMNANLLQQQLQPMQDHAASTSSAEHFEHFELDGNNRSAPTITTDSDGHLGNNGNVSDGGRRRRILLQSMRRRGDLYRNSLR